MARMRKYGESKTARIMMATVPHVTSGLGLRKFQADGFLLTRVYKMFSDFFAVIVPLQEHSNWTLFVELSTLHTVARPSEVHL